MIFIGILGIIVRVTIWGMAKRFIIAMTIVVGVVVWALVVWIKNLGIR